MEQALTMYQDPCLCVVHWHNLQIMDMRDHLVHHHYVEMRRTYARLRDRHPQGILGCALARPASANGSTTKSRAEGAQLMKDYADVLKLVSVVIEGDGIWEMSIRSIVRAVNVLSGNRALKVHNSVVSAATTLAPLVGDLCRAPVTSDDVVDVIQRSSGEHTRYRAHAATTVAHK